MDDRQRCPQCGIATTDPDEVLTDGSILSCVVCGMTAIWEGGPEGLWRPVTEAERAELMQDEEFLRVQDMAMGLRMFRLQDAEKLRDLIRETIGPFLPPLPGKLFGAARDRALDKMSMALLEALLRAGYHRHPSQAESKLLDMLEDKE